METDAEREETYAAGLGLGVSSIFCNQCSRHFGGAGVFDGMLAIAAVVEAGTDMLSKEGTQTNLPSHIASRLVAQFEVGASDGAAGFLL